MTRRWGLLLVLALASAALSADPAPPSVAGSRIERTAQFVDRVNQAIDRGVAWLRAEAKADGSFPDYAGHPGATTALAYHTLRVCGVSREDPAAVRMYESLRRSYRKEQLQTYSAALYLMAIWSHGTPVAKRTDDRDVRLTAEDRQWAEEITRALAGAQTDDGAWSYDVELNARSTGSGASGGRRRNGFDHSNTQYALLGLKCAARSGVAIDPAVWKLSLLHFLATQETDGPEAARGAGAGKVSVQGKGRTFAPVMDHARGWGYRTLSDKGRGVYASMTAAGVSSVVICRSELYGSHLLTSKLDADSERSVWDGLAWLGARWGTARGMGLGGQIPGLPGGVADRRFFGHDFYEAYGVERAGVLAGVDWMGELDWYGAGAEPILTSQRPDGSWIGGYRTGPGNDDAIDTCFALLFLKKGTTPVRRGAVTQVGGDSDINFAAAPKLTGQDLEDFLDLVLSRWSRAADDALKARLLDGATAAGPRIVLPLLVRMDAADVAERGAAHALLRRATGLDFGWSADAPQAARDEASAKWQAWWISAQDRVAYDPASRRLVVR